MMVELSQVCDSGMELRWYRVQLLVMVKMS